MLIYNNLLINGNSTKYQPFLLNLISGRRRLLMNDEIPLVKKMLDGTPFDAEMQQLFDKLVAEKQFFTDEMRKQIEDTLESSGYWKERSLYAADYYFSIELTRFCNMSCPFCYAASRRQPVSMTKSHIDAIMAFYQKYADDPQKIENTTDIRITGGEPLFNEETASLIQYIADKWKKAKIVLFTNGINLLKYYHLLPIARLHEVHISLDGLPEVHLKHRFSKSVPDPSIYENIIGGIQRLLQDGVHVKVKTVVDRDTYQQLGEFRAYLKERGILDSPNCEQQVGITFDYSSPNELLESANNMEDVRNIEAYLQTLGVAYSTYPGTTALMQMISRVENTPSLPRCVRCKCDILANYFFACNGKVYLCDIVDDNIGVLGTFYPEANLDHEAVMALYNRTILLDPKCAQCPYKFVCLGGCPHSAYAKGQKMTCGVFESEEFLDNLEFDYTAIIRQRMQEKQHETNP